MIHRVRFPLFFSLSTTVLLVASALQADVRVPALFTDNAVLQQGRRVPVWGWADDGEEVTVTFRDQTAKTKAKGGKWMVRLGSLKAGGPDALVVEGRNRIELKNVMVGEVWVCSGQSNMEWPLTRAFESKTAIETSANPRIRLFTVPKLKANKPVEDVKAKWEECGPQTVPGFSAVAYYFGRDLQKALGVPVGLIHTSWGGSPAEVWMREEVLAKNAGYKQDLLDGYAVSLKAYEEALAKFQTEQAELKRQGQPSTKKPPGRPSWKPSELYNGMIAPLIPYAIQGAIWYQGESNAGRAWQYRTLFADMIRNWRADWRQGNFTFLAVQLAPWDKGRKRSLAEITAAPVESDWAELREAQNLAAQRLPNVGIAVITDVGDKDDIHPTKKEPVGARLALAARGIAYKEEITWSGPVFKESYVFGCRSMRDVRQYTRSGLPFKGVMVDVNRVVLAFDHVGSGLQLRGGTEDWKVWSAATGDVTAGPLLTGFAIAGPDGKFVWAEAFIHGKNVVVSSPAVPNPVAVRYGWADYPVVNLSNQDGLPASPFRTDNLPMVTAPKTAGR